MTPHDRVRGRLLVASAAGLALLTTLAPASAEVAVDVEVSPDGQELADDLGIDVEELATRMEASIAKGMNLVDVNAYLRSFGNATSFAARGIGVDYASNSESFTLGVAGGLAVNVEGLTGGDDFSAGIGASFTIMGGMNLARWKHRELTIFGNFFHSGSSSGLLRGGITAVGLHGQYKFFQPTKGLKRLLLQWGGLDVTGGLEFSRWTLGVGGDFGSDFTVDGTGGESATLAGSLNGNFDLATTTFVVPLEVTTNVRLLYVLSLYVGGGLDLQFGRSSVDVGIGGNATYTKDGEETTVASLQVSADERSRPAFVAGHALLGAQLNIWKLRLFMQTTMQPFTDFGVATGVRFAW